MTTWKSYLLNVPGKEEYNACAGHIATTALQEDVHFLVKKLEESDEVLYVSRNAIDNKTQFLFMFVVQGCSFLLKTARYFALSGLGSHSNPVRFATDKAFHFAPTEKQVPPFGELLNVATVEDLENLIPNENWVNMKIPHFALLVPLPGKVALNHKDDSPELLLTHFVRVLQGLATRETVPDEDEGEEKDDQESNKSRRSPDDRVEKDTAKETATNDDPETQEQPYPQRCFVDTDRHIESAFFTYGCNRLSLVSRIIAWEAICT